MEPTESPYPPLPQPILTTRFGRVFAFMPDGERLVVSGMGAISPARMVSLATAQNIFTFEKPLSDVGGVAVAEDGVVIAIATRYGRVYLYDPQTGRKKQTLKAGNDGQLSGLAFAPGSHSLLHSSWGGLTGIDVNEKPTARSLRTSSPWPDNTSYDTVAFSPLGDRFAAVWFGHSTGTNISLFSWPSGDEISRFPCAGVEDSHQYCLSQIVFSPDDRSLLLSIPDGSVTLWPLAGLEPPESGTTWIERPAALDPERLGAGCLSFSPDGALLAYGLGNMLGLWAWPSGVCLGKWRLPGRDPMAFRLGFSSSSREVAVSRYGSGGIFVYRVADLIGARNIHGNQ